MISTAYLQKRMRNMQWYDISLTKMSTFLFALFVASLFPELLQIDKKIYLFSALILAIRPGYQFYFSNSRS